MQTEEAPLLSVIVPIYNGERYVAPLFACFAAQTAQNFELILVDDGSTDGTRAQLDRFAAAAAFPVTVVPTGAASVSADRSVSDGASGSTSGGVSAARNTGMALARGQYIGFVDADDRVGPGYTALLQKAVRTGPFDALFFQSVRVGENGPFVPKTEEAALQPMSSPEMLNKIASNPTRFGVYDLFLRRSAADETGLRFAEGYAYYEDYDFLYRAAAAAHTILFTEQQHYFYVKHEGSAVAQFRVERVSCIKLLENLTPWLKEREPEFAETFQKWVIPRIYWSVMWQACLAFSSRDAVRFSHMAGMRRHLWPLRSYPDRKVRFSTWLFLVSPHAFIAAARLLGRRRTEIGKTDLSPFRAYFSAERKRAGSVSKRV